MSIILELARCNGGEMERGHLFSCKLWSKGVSEPKTAGKEDILLPPSPTVITKEQRNDITTFTVRSRQSQSKQQQQHRT